MKVTVVGAGAMGASYGGLLSVAGHEVGLIDIRADHVAAIERDGLHVDGVLGDHRVRLSAAAAPAKGQRAEVAIVFADTNNTRAAAKTAAGLLSRDGVAVTFQNGLGNVEALQAEIGPKRVLGGSSMCGATSRGPGHVTLTHMGLTSVGEIDGRASARATALVEALRGAGFEAQLAPDIMAVIWQKFVVNCGVNAIAATTGLRPGEIARLADVDAFQDRVLAEVMAVIAAKGITLPNPDIVAAIKDGCRRNFNLPSMLQHVRAGRKTEIEALNGALIREAKAAGVATPCNEALVALLKGRELARMREVAEPDLDYDAWQARVAAGTEA
ncbi:MAG TPA: ketopantoate reductase family protein [Alphaproteobacteria bacterium]